MPLKPKLTFEAGKFVFTGKKPIGRKSWTCGEGGKYFTTDIGVAAELRPYADERAERIFNRAFVKHYAGPIRPLPSFLDPHQVDGVRWVLSRSRSYLAHAPGAGKTLQFIVAALRGSVEGQALIIVPPSLTANWAREVQKWSKSLGGFLTGDACTVSIVPETLHQACMEWEEDFIIVPDSMLTKEWVLNKLVEKDRAGDFHIVGADEASRFKEAASERTKALFGGQLKDGRKSPGLIYRARHAVLLDGSPMPNRPMELWAPTYAMSPESIDFMSQQDFGFRYCGATLNKFGAWEFKHSAREEELHARLKHSFMHVVEEEKLGHPERRRSILFMSEDVRSVEQRRWERGYIENLNFSDIDENMAQGDLARFRRELGIRKVAWSARYILERLERGESVLAFAWHREVCIELAQKLKRYRPGLVMGGTPSDEREKHFRNFQSRRTKLIIGNIGAMGRGHNLQRADRVIFVEYSWTDELNKQCEKRASRKGRDADLPVRCDYVVSPGSLDEPVLNAVFKKAERVKRVIG